ncbi:MAG: SDR family oxidoreductase [Acidobacteriota bacterium]
MKGQPCVDIVTGGAGFIGSHLCRALLESGRRVRVIDNLSSGRLSNLDGLFEAHPEAFEFVEADIRDLKNLRPCFQGVADVYHQAAMTSVEQSVREPQACHAVNCTGALNVLSCARDAGASKVVLASSSAVYGDTAENPCREGRLPAPASPYAASKLAAEHYARVFDNLYGLPTASLRYFNVYGPRQDPQSAYAAVIPRFITRLLQGKPPVIYGDGGQSRDFVHVEDVVSANLLAARSRQGGLSLNIASGRSHDLNQLLALLNTILGRDLKPVHQAARPGDIRRSEADIRLARQRIGFVPRTGFEEGLRRTAATYREA